MTVLDIEKAIARRFKREQYFVDRVYLFDHGDESDFVIITNGEEYAIEFEIKLSYADFRKDFLKEKHKHLKLAHALPGLPNRFYFVCPEGLIQKEELPEHYGLIWVEEYGSTKIVKRAPFLHKRSVDYSKSLLRKVYWKKNHWKDTIQDQRTKIKELEYVRDTLEKSLNSLGADVCWQNKDKLYVLDIQH